MRNNNIHINIIYNNINKKQEQKMLHQYLKKQKQEQEPEQEPEQRQEQEQEEVLPSTFGGHARVQPLSSRSCSEPLGGGGSFKKGRGPSPTCYMRYGGGVRMEWGG